MSDLYMHEFVDIAWDESRPSDDHIVPDPGNKRLNDHLILGDHLKKHHSELASNSSYTVDKSSARYVDQRGDQGEISSVSKRRKTMLDKDSWPHKPDSEPTCTFDRNPVKEASSLASDSTMPSAHGLKSSDEIPNSSEFCGLDAILDEETSIADNYSFNYPMGDINHTSSDINCFVNSDNKDSSDLMYCDWPEIGNFEDIDRIVRSCGSTFGLGVSREAELAWLSSDDTGGSGDAFKLDVKFSYLEPNEMENISENHDFSNDCSLTNSSISSGPIKYKDSSWVYGKSDSYRSSVIGTDVADSKDGLISQEQVPKSCDNTQPRISMGTGISGFISCQTSASDSYSYSQNPISYVHSDNSNLSDPSSIHLKPSIVKSESNDSVPPVDSSQASNQLQYMKASPDPGSEEAALAISEQSKKLQYCPGSAMSSEIDDISLEAASFRQLQLVMEQLDLRTKLCIRDSLYRLAESAECRHNLANLNADCGEGDATKRYTSFTDMETDTNPIDRSIAHLLFHRPMDLSNTAAQDSFPLKPPSAITSSVASPSALVVDNLVSEENVSELEEVPDC